MLPRQPSHPPITLPTTAPCWIATRNPSPWARTSRLSSSSVSVWLGMAPARSQRANIAGHSSKRQGRITVIAMSPRSIVFAPHQGPSYHTFSTSRGDSMAIKRDFTLDAKYRQGEGLILLSGIQALVRLPLDQHRADKRRGLNTATLISGYRGSPPGGLALPLQPSPALLPGHNVAFLSGVNEDLGATAVYGSQLANLFPQPKYDGVLGMWYGKGPGVDRTGDIFKHANFAGVSRHGGVLALGGDDPLSKSSTIPSHSEVAFYDALFPVLYPGSAQEILDLGRLGFELSRYSGLWVGFKIVTNVADEIGTAEVAPDRIVVADPGFLYEGRPWQARQNPLLMPPWGLETEREIHYGRLEAAKAFAAANKLNRITLPTPNAWLGIAAPGKTYYDLREALAELGLDTAALRQYGIRLMQIEMMFPMEPGVIREFARGLEELMVIEEKRAFCELFIRDILYNQAERPRVVGKQDEQGRPLVPADAELDADRIAQILATRVERQHHLQDPLQLGGGDDGRPGRGRRDAGAGADALARGRRRQAHHRDDRRARQVPEGHRVGRRSRSLAPRPARRVPATAARHFRRDSAGVRPALRRREAPAP